MTLEELIQEDREISDEIAYSAFLYDVIYYIKSRPESHPLYAKMLSECDTGLQIAGDPFGRRDARVRVLGGLTAIQRSRNRKKES